MALEKLFLPQKIRQGKRLLSLDSLKRVVVVFFSFSPFGQAVLICKSLRLLLSVGLKESQSC